MVQPPACPVGIGFALQKNIIKHLRPSGHLGHLRARTDPAGEGDVIDRRAAVERHLSGASISGPTQVETFDQYAVPSFVPYAGIFCPGKLTNWTRNGRLVRREVDLWAWPTGPQISSLSKEAAQTRWPIKEHQIGPDLSRDRWILFNDFAGQFAGFPAAVLGAGHPGTARAASPRTSEKVIETQSSPRGANIESLSRKWMYTCALMNETVPVEIAAIPAR